MSRSSHDIDKRKGSEGASSPVKSDGFFAKSYCLVSIVGREILSLRLQRVLTLLTMAIGSLTLAATLFTREGALKNLWRDLDQLMGNRVIVYPDAGPNQILLQRRPSSAITKEDVEYLKSHMPDARYVVPQYFGRVQVESRSERRYMPVDGITTELEQEFAYQPVSGAGFSLAADRSLVWECMLTGSAAKVLGVRLENKPTIRVGNHRFHVVGIVTDPPEADKRFQARVIVPFSSARYLWGQPGVVETIVVAWRDSTKIESTIGQLRAALDECRAPEAYYLSSSQFAIRKRRNIVSNYVVLGLTQSLFCILVASLGVVNVMLADVVRRAREFAIRISMGARHGDIVIIVLLESFLLGLFGAIIGIVAAALISSPLCNFISSRIPEASQLIPDISVKSMVIPLLACSLSGLAAGIIPALRTRKLDILKVLRAE